MKPDSLFAIAAFLFAVALLSLGVSLAIALVSAGAQILTGWVLITLQVSAAMSAVALATGLITSATKKAISEIEALFTRHKAAFEAMQKRAPPLVVAVSLVAQAVVVVTDKAFDGNVPATLAVTLLLMLWFFVANEAIERLPSPWRWIGYGLWFLGVLLLPFLMWVHRGFDAAALLSEFNGLSVEFQVVFLLGAALFVVMPFLVPRDA